MTATEFRLVSGSTLFDLQSEIQRHLEAGYRLAGSMINAGDRLQQPMVLFKPDYLVLRETSIETLNREIRHLLDRGYEPAGGLAVEKLNSIPCFIQAMRLVPPTL